MKGKKNMAKRDSAEQIKRRVTQLQQEKENLEEAVVQMQQAVDAILREVIKKYGKRNKDGEFQLSIPAPTIGEGAKVLADRDGESYILTLKKEAAKVEKQMGEPRSSEAE
jgi:hypothetical protein